MARAWIALVLVAGLAAMAHVAQRRPSYEEIVTKALRIFNQRRRGQSLFGLVEAIPPADSNSTAKVPFSFRVKETVCISARRRQPQECAFKEDGEERNCTGVFVGRRGRILRVDCRPGRPRQPDASQPDAGQPDAGQPDAGQPEVGQPDAGQPDAGQPDVSQPDVSPPDAGQPEVGQPEVGQPEMLREKRSTEPAEAASEGPDTSKLPPAVRDMYERAKYDIIANILRNF